MPAPFWQRALQRQLANPTWSGQQSLSANLGQNLQEMYNHGRRLIQEHEGLLNLRSADPAFGFQRMRAAMQQGDLSVRDPIDRFLFRAPVG